MGHTRDECPQHLAARWWWEVARRDDLRVARRLDRQQAVDGVSRLDEGAGLEDCVHGLHVIGVLTLLAEVPGTASPRQMGPCGPYVWRYGLQTGCGMERLKALPSVRCSEEAWRRWVGCKAPQVRQGLGQRGATTRPVERVPGPRCAEPRAPNLGPWHVRDREAVCQGAIRALAQVGVLGAQGTGMAAGTELETTVRARGGGQATRQGRRAETGGHGLRRIAAVPTMPWAVTVGPMQAHEVRWARALVTQARMQLAGASRRAPVVFAQGVGAGTTL